MNQEKRREAYEKMLKKCPDILTPMKANRWSPVGKNTIYAALKNGEIESYTYKGGYIFTKDAFIDYLVKTATDKGKRYSTAGGRSSPCRKRKARRNDASDAPRLLQKIHRLHLR